MRDARFLRVAPYCFVALALALALHPAAAQPEEAAGQRPRLGVALQELDEALQEALELTEPGVLVNRVAPGSAADAGGVRVGDVITHFRREPVGSIDALKAAVGHWSGDRTPLEVVRRGRSRTLEVELAGESGRRGAEARRRHRHRAPRVREKIHTVHPPSFLGVRLETLGEELAAYFDVAPGSGVLVVGVVEDSPADAAGLRAGDVVKAIGGRAVESPQALRRAVRALEPGEVVSVDLVRHGRARQIDVEIGQHEGSTFLDKPFPKIDLEGLPELMDELGAGLERRGIIIDTERLGDWVEEHAPPREALDARLEELEDGLRRLRDELEALHQRLDRREH